MKQWLAMSMIVMLLMPFLPVGAAYNANSARNYLEQHADSPWATMGLAAVGASNIPTDYLQNVQATSAVQLEAPILALVAAGKDPHSFGGHDYISQLKTYVSNQQIGDSSTLNDDFFGVLALIAADEAPTAAVVSDSRAFILSHQHADGGWGFTTTSDSDTNMTSAGILALLASGSGSSDQAITQAVQYLKATQNVDGGFPYAIGSASDSSSTAWVKWVMNALSQQDASWSKNGVTPTQFLESLQDASGFFKYQGSSSEDSFSPVTTAYAVIALSNKPLPLNPIAASAVVTVPFRIEGSTQTVCTGTATGPTALDVVKNAATICGFTYSIQDTSFGPYLSTIVTDAAQGSAGWLYFVNNISPDVGAADYQLHQNDQVLWYYGEWGWLPTRLSLAPTTISSAQSTTVTVEKFENGLWQPLVGAAVDIGASSVTTDVSGHASANPPDGFYRVRAAKQGFVRSNAIDLTVGDPASSQVTLGVMVDNPFVSGVSTTSPSGISFIVDPSVLDFGTVSPGHTVSKALTLNNNGGIGIHIETTVSGDDIFRDGISVNTTPWQNFGADVAIGAHADLAVGLGIPQGSSAITGQHQGEMIFWAMPQ